MTNLGQDVANTLSRCVMSGSDCRCFVPCLIEMGGYQVTKHVYFNHLFEMLIILSSFSSRNEVFLHKHER